MYRCVANTFFKPLAGAATASALLALALGLGVPTAHAQVSEVAPKGIYVEIGGAEHSTYAAGAGLIWPWSLRGSLLGGEITGSTDAFINHWNSKSWSRREGQSLIGVVPLLRYRFSDGRSPWFVEGGVGLSVLDSRIQGPDKSIGSSFNFYDALAAGFNFGSDRRHEVSLRVTHLSNAGIKKPNPGENFIRLRYTALF